MSSATANSVTVQIDPTKSNLQADVIPGATPTKAGAMTAAQAAQLASIVAGTVSSVSGTSPIVSTGGLNPDISITPATPVAAGSMSAADKAKLDALNPSEVTQVTGSAPITSTGGATPDIGITPATTLAAGSLSAADKTKLDGLTPGAAVASVSGVAPIASTGGTTPAISIAPSTTLAPGSMSAADKTKLDAIPLIQGVYQWTAAKTWAQVWAEVVAGSPVGAPYGYIQTDNTASTRTITAAQGPYDFTNVIFQGLQIVGPGALTSINFESGALIDAGAYVALRARGPSLRFVGLAALMTADANKRVVIEMYDGAMFGATSDVTLFRSTFAGIHSINTQGRLYTSSNTTNPLFYLNNAGGFLAVIQRELGGSNGGYLSFAGLIAGGAAGSSVIFYGTPGSFGIARATSVAAPTTLTSGFLPSTFFPANTGVGLQTPSATNKGETYFNTTNGGLKMSDGVVMADIQHRTVTAVKTSAYGALLGDLVRCDPTGGGFTVTLPTAVGIANREITIKNASASTNTITVATTSSQTIDGVVGGSISAAWAVRTYVSDGANWLVLSQ